MNKLIKSLCFALLLVISQNNVDIKVFATSPLNAANCPRSIESKTSTFRGSIIYVFNFEQSKSTLWQLLPDLSSRLLLSTTADGSPTQGSMTSTKDMLAAVTYSYPGYGLRQYEAGILVLDNQGQVRYLFPWRESWTDFYGWTNDKRLIIGHRSEDLSENGILLLDLEGNVTSYYDLPNALNPLDKGDELWESISFSVSPNAKQVVYDAHLGSDEWFPRGLMLANLADRKVNWKTANNNMDTGIGVGSWSSATWAPDGMRFVYTYKEGDHDPELALVDSSGNEQPLTHMNDGLASSDIYYVQGGIVWNSLGNQFAFWKSGVDRLAGTRPSGMRPRASELSELMVLDIASGELRSLCIIRGGLLPVYWSPNDSSLIVGDTDAIDLINLKQNTIAKLPVEGELPQLLGWLSND